MVVALALVVLHPSLVGQAASLYQAGVLGVDVNPAHYLTRLARQFRLHLGPLVPADPSEIARTGVALTSLVFVVAATAAGLTKPAAAGRRRLAAIGALGLILAALGYAVLVLSPAVLGATRTQFLAAPGIALFLASLIRLVATLAPARVRAASALALATVVVAIGAGHTLGMQRQWDRISYYPRQRACLTALVQKAPALRPGTLLLLLDEDGTWPYALSFYHAVRLVYGEAVTGYSLGGERFLYQLSEGPTAIHVTPWPVIQGPWREAATAHRPEQIVAFRLAGGSVSLLEHWIDTHLPPLPAGARYDPRAVITRDTPPASRRVLD